MTNDPRKYVVSDPKRMPKARVPPPLPGSDRMTPERLNALRTLAREPLRPDDPARLRDVQASLQDALDEIDRLGKERDALLAACVREYRNGPTRWRVRLPAIWPGEPGNPETYAPGDWDSCGDHWCFDNRDDAVAALCRAAGIGEDAS